MHFWNQKHLKREKDSSNLDEIKCNRIAYATNFFLSMSGTSLLSAFSTTTCMAYSN